MQGCRQVKEKKKERYRGTRKIEKPRRGTFLMEKEPGKEKFLMEQKQQQQPFVYLNYCCQHPRIKSSIILTGVLV